MGALDRRARRRRAALTLAACALAATRILLAPTTALAAARFDVQADATLKRNAPALRGGRFELRASMSVPQAPAVAAPALAGGPYLLNALASTSSLVCYYDTIFRDDFDGDGF